MKKVWIVFFIVLQIIMSGCLMNYYSAQLPDPGKTHVGMGTSQYYMSLPDSAVSLYTEVFMRRGFPMGFDAGFDLHFISGPFPYAAELSARKQFKLLRLFNNDIKFNIGTGGSMILLPSLQVSADLMFGRTALRFQARRMTIKENEHDVELQDLGNMVFERLLLRAEQDMKISIFNIVLYGGAAWDRRPSYTWEGNAWYSQIGPYFNPVQETTAEFSKPYFIMGFSVYFDI